MNWTKVDPPQPLPDDESIAGRVVKYEDGQIGVVGNINESGGTCGCCGSSANIVAYSDDLREAFEKEVEFQKNGPRWIDEGVGHEMDLRDGRVLRVTEGRRRVWTWSMAPAAPWTERTRRGAAGSLEEAKRAAEEAAGVRR